MRENIKAAIKLLADSLSEKIKVEAIYVFGSSIRGDWLKHSDIDLVIVSQDFKNLPFMKRIDIIEEIQWRKKITPHINAIPLTQEELNEKIATSAALINASKYWKKISIKNNELIF
ncbi:nucleotidyltransferase domain-containing protein [Candidatus Bathyarchaeota archaeon]|nr:nucleotidyltransferase domain-containing protein [Candidatus Bathyarchaeota archaeon]